MGPRGRFLVSPNRRLGAQRAAVAAAVTLALAVCAGAGPLRPVETPRAPGSREEAMSIRPSAWADPLGERLPSEAMPAWGAAALTDPAAAAAREAFQPAFAVSPGGEAGSDDPAAPPAVADAADAPAVAGIGRDGGARLVPDPCSLRYWRHVDGAPWAEAARYDSPEPASADPVWSLLGPEEPDAEAAEPNEPNEEELTAGGQIVAGLPNPVFYVALVVVAVGLLVEGWRLFGHAGRDHGHRRRSRQPHGRGNAPVPERSPPRGRHREHRPRRSRGRVRSIRRW